MVVDGLWHTVRLSLRDQTIQIFVDGERHGEELDAASGHDFLGPYLTAFLIGGVKDENVQPNKVLTGAFLSKVGRILKKGFGLILFLCQ